MSDLAPIDLAAASSGVTAGAYTLVETAQGYLQDRNVQIAIAVCLVGVGAYFFWYRKKDHVSAEPELYQASGASSIDSQFSSPLLDDFDQSDPSPSPEQQAYDPPAEQQAYAQLDEHAYSPIAH
jgi:hypothetical protein